MDEKAFQRYLATGDYTPSAVPAEDMSLAEHDARWHPDGYKKGDKCLFRANLDKGDKSDADIANATPKQGGISGIFTGSAADYAKPSLLKVGTGEGTQVYGWGLYGSTERGVAEGYADNYDSDEIEYLGERPPPKIAGFVEKNLKVHHGDIDATVQDLSDALFPPFKESAQWLKDNKGSIRYTRKDTPHLYEQTFFTNRAPGDESHLLNWYEPISEEQLKWINRQAKLENLENLDYLEGFLDRHPGTTAHNIYSRLWDALGSPQAASEFLYRAGIDGIKYPVDSFGGKSVKDGDKAGWNYVSFSDDNIRVDRKWRDGEEVDDAARTKIERYLALDAAPSDPDFESKHPRGNSGNRGQFRKSEKTIAKLDEADAAVGSAPAPQGGGKVSPAEDAAYLSAVKKGDMETASKMVREAATKHGYETFGLHGTKGEFTVFDKKRIGSANDEGWLGRGFYFWDKSNQTYAEQYANGGKVLKVMLSMEEPYLIDKDEMERLIDAAEHHDVKTLEDFSDEIKANGYDSVIDGDGQMLVFDPNQIKSADPVTYDDEGKVIPLSKRFDSTNPDIRY